MACSADCSHAHHNESVENPIAPVKTRMDAYRRALTSRIDDVRAALRTTIVDNDAAHLRANVDPADSFPFRSDAAKQAAFDAWLEDSLDSGFLETTGRDAVRGGRHYTAAHVRDAYERGLEWADDQMREAGVPVDSPVSPDFRRGVHADQLEQLYLRNYKALEKISNDLDADISRTFSEALAEGVNPREAGRRLSDEVNTYRNRAETLARTEFQNSMSNASARRYAEYGVDQVRILTNDPCEICADLASRAPFPVEEAAGLLPNRTHPNCICTLAPVTD